MTKKKIKIEFAPGCFDNFDGTQEELDDLVKHIQTMAESGELMKNSKSVDDAWDDLSLEEQEVIHSTVEGLDRKLQ